jgi:hypothetical protein
MFDFSKSEIETITIEARFDPAFALWDRSGDIWAEIQSQFPELKIQAAAPSQVVFESPNTRAALEIEAFRVSCRGTIAEKLVAQISQRMLEVCSERLNIAVFKRVGLRELRICHSEEKEEAVSAVSPFLSAVLTEGAQPDIKTVALNWGMRQESETSGLFASLRTEEREITLNVPWEVRHLVPNKLSKIQLVVLDSDYYTIGTIRREALNFEEWSSQASRAIKRYWKRVLQ